MRVGILDYRTSRQRSGVEYYSLGLVHALAETLRPGRLVVYTNDRDAFDRIECKATIRSIPGASSRITRLLWQHLSLPSAAVRDRLDVLHCPAYVMPLRPCSVPCVITIHDTHALDRPEWCSLSNRVHYRLALPRSMRNASAIVAVSEDTRHAILAQCQTSQSRVHVISPGIDAIFRSVDTEGCDPACRTKHDLPQHFVLHVGNVEDRKNLEPLVAAVQALREQGLDVPLVLAGQAGRCSSGLSRALARGRARGDVRPLGYVPREDLPSLYRLADAVVVPSRHEGFGFPPLEAMACGTPVVSSMTGAMADNLRGAVMSVVPLSPKAIREAISKIFLDKALCIHIQREGLRRASSYTWGRTVQQMLALYQAVVGLSAAS